MANVKGKFLVKVIDAQLSRDTEFFGYMDPYCIIRFGSQIKKTGIHFNAGKRPRWNQLFDFHQTKEQSIHIEVWDSNEMTSDSYIGGAIIPISKVLQVGSVSDWYPIIYKNKNSGQINIELTWLPHIAQPTSSEGGQIPQSVPYTAYPPNAYPPNTAYPNNPYNPYTNPADYTNPQGFVQAKAYPGYEYKNGVYVYTPYSQNPPYNPK